MRLGIFGGSFDPPHVGHLLVALDAAERLTLDQLVLVPTATQPLKAAGAQASAEHRLAMTRLLVDGLDGMSVSDVEASRPGLSFTVDTLRHFATQFATADRYLLVGSDAFASFGQWRDPKGIVSLARVAVLHRQLDGDAPPELPAGVDPSRVEHLATRRVDVSSTEVRQRIRAGKPLRGFVTDAVAGYIARHGLYR